jgi:hypothetical protein
MTNATIAYGVLVLDTTTGEYVPAIVNGAAHRTPSRSDAVRFADRVRHYLATDNDDPYFTEDDVIVEAYATV